MKAALLALDALTQREAEGELLDLALQAQRIDESLQRAHPLAVQRQGSRVVDAPLQRQADAPAHGARARLLWRRRINERTCAAWWA